MRQTRKRFERWRLFTMVFLWCAYSCLYFAFSILSSTQSLIISGLVSSKKDIGLIITIFRGVRFLPKLTGGYVVDIFGGDWMFGIGQIIAGLGTIFFGLPLFGSSFWYLTTTSCIQQIGTVYPWPGLIKICSNWIDYKSTGIVMSIMSLSYLFGASIVTFIISLFIKLNLGWRFVYYLSGSILTASGILSLIFLKQSPSKLSLSQYEPRVNPDNVLGREGNETGFKGLSDFFATSCLPFLRTGSFYCVLVWYMALTFVRYVFSDWFTLYMTEQIHTTPFISTLSSAGFTLFGGLGAVVMGYVNDKYSTKVRNIFMIVLEVILCLLLAFMCAFNYYVDLSKNNSFVISSLPVVALSLVGFCGIAPSSVTAAMSINFGGRKVSATHSSLLDGFGTLMTMLSGTVGRSLLDESSMGWTRLFFLLFCCSLFIVASNILIIFVEKLESQRKIAQNLEDPSSPLQSDISINTVTTSE
ncbi:10 TM domain-containing transmembrane protein [Acrasis kona]|uniref:10 TM domain-containing transmembrane protein n=1 Tax=Acrasis kona TaxID=1008807 RepID=A0AAW2Z581_9EUKA